MTNRCLESLYDQDVEFPGIVVVDNGSDPPVVPHIRESFPEVDMVELDRNYGFTGGCNRGLERALEYGTEYVFLLNNDTIVPWGTIARLAGVMEEYPSVGMATPLIIRPDDEKTVGFYHGAILRDCGRHVHHDNGGPANELERTTRYTEFAPACAIMLRSAALRDVGLFDEALFTNWEDYDLCIRMADAGWRILSVGELEVVHAHGQTTGRKSPFITYYATRNRLICLWRYGTLAGIARNALFILRTFYWQFCGQGRGNWPARRAMLLGMWHFLTGVRGPGRAPLKRSD